MNVRSLTDAIADDDGEMMRAGFRLLVETDGRSIEAVSAGLRVVLLNRLRDALAEDAQPMPDETCAALSLPAGSTYAAGAAMARRDSARLAQHLNRTGRVDRMSRPHLTHSAQDRALGSATMKFSACLFAFAMLGALPAVAQEGKSAQEVGMSIAKKRGYANPACYATVFASYASKNAQGQWRAPTGKASTGYKNEQHSKCGISI